MWSSDNVLVIEAAQQKKGGGVHAVLSLLQDLMAFQDKVSAATEAQDLGENKQTLQQFSQSLSQMYSSLLDMAKGGVQAVRQPEVTSPPVLVDDNAIQELP